MGGRSTARPDRRSGAPPLQPASQQRQKRGRTGGGGASSAQHQFVQFQQQQAQQFMQFLQLQPQQQQLQLRQQQQRGRSRGGGGAPAKPNVPDPSRRVAGRSFLQAASGGAKSATTTTTPEAAASASRPAAASGGAAPAAAPAGDATTGAGTAQQQPRDAAQDAVTAALRAEHQEAVQRRDAHRRSKYFSEELDLVLDGQVTDLRKRLDASKPAADLYNGHLKILERAEAQAAKIGKQLQAAWAAVATSQDAAKALEEKHRLALEHAADLRAATAAKADAAGAQPPDPAVLAAVDTLLKHVEVERVTSAKLGRGSATDAALASITDKISDLQAELSVLTTGRDVAGDTPMAGAARGTGEPSAPVWDPSGAGAAPLAASYELQHAAEQQRVAQLHEQQIQQLRASQLLEQQTLLEKQSQQPQQTLAHTPPIPAVTTTAADVTLPANAPACIPVEEDGAGRDRLVATAQLLAAGLADDTEAISEARSALRGRLSQIADYGPGWLQEGIDMFNRTLQMQAAQSDQGGAPTDQLPAKSQNAVERPFDPLDT